MITKILKEKNGFTLMELLIVVAVMVVLLGVTIPMFTQQLNDTKVAVDDANLRSAKALAVTMFMTGEEEFSEIMYFDIANTIYVLQRPEPYGETEGNDGKVINAKVNDAGDGVDVQWE